LDCRPSPSANCRSTIVSLAKQSPLYASLCVSLKAYCLRISLLRLISERTRAALAQQKASGTRPGNRTNPPAAASLGRRAQAVAADRLAANLAPLIEKLRVAGITDLRGLADALNARGIRTARGGRWHVSNVRNVMRRVGEIAIKSGSA